MQGWAGPGDCVVAVKHNPFLKKLLNISAFSLKHCPGPQPLCPQSFLCYSCVPFDGFKWVDGSLVLPGGCAIDLHDGLTMLSAFFVQHVVQSFIRVFIALFLLFIFHSLDGEVALGSVSPLWRLSTVVKVEQTRYDRSSMTTCRSSRVECFVSSPGFSKKCIMICILMTPEHMHRLPTAMFIRVEIVL